MALDLLYPLVHAELEALLTETGASGCMLTGIAGFSGASVGHCFPPDHLGMKFELLPAGMLLVFVADKEIGKRVEAAVAKTLEAIVGIIPHKRGPTPGRGESN